MSEPSPKLHQPAEKSQERAVHTYKENEEKYDTKILKELLTCKSLRRQVDRHLKNKNNTKPGNLH